MINPTNEDILKIREEAHAAVQQMGADSPSIEILVEIDSRTNILRATAYGATSMTSGKDSRTILSNEDRVELVAQSMKVTPVHINLCAKTNFFQVYSSEWTDKHFGGLMKNKMRSIRVLDTAGSIRLQIRNGAVQSSLAEAAEDTISIIVEEHSQWGDAGKVIPDIFVLAGPKIIDLSGLMNVDQIKALIKAELKDVPTGSETVVLAKLG